MNKTLPELPEPARIVTYNESKGYTTGMFTADQMREYARASLAQTGAEPLTDEQIDSVTRQQWGEQLGVMMMAHREYARAIVRAAQPAPLPAREPLSEWQIIDMAIEAGDEHKHCFVMNKDGPHSVVAFARAIESAHGITATAAAQGDAL